VSPGANATNDAGPRRTLQRSVKPVLVMRRGGFGYSKAVVDSWGRITGVRELRVVDSSSFPLTNPGHTQGTTHAHAESMTMRFLEVCRDGKLMEPL
jgi:choline dehydrogenase